MDSFVGMTALVYPQTVATVSNFLLAMIQHPEVLIKAREEIDGVVGTERLPGFNDRQYLPYGKSFSETSQDPS